MAVRSNDRAPILTRDELGDGASDRVDSRGGGDVHSSVAFIARRWCSDSGPGHEPKKGRKNVLEKEHFVEKFGRCSNVTAFQVVS